MVRNGIAVLMKLAMVLLLNIAPIQFGTAISDEEWVQIVEPHLTASFLSGMFYYPPPKNVVILDANILKDKLPGLERVRWIVLSEAQIRDSAETNGEVEFLRLSKFIRYSNSIQIVWESDNARFFSNLHKVIWGAHVVETDSYYLTVDGWKAGASGVMRYLLLAPPRK